MKAAMDKRLLSLVLILAIAFCIDANVVPDIVYKTATHYKKAWSIDGSRAKPVSVWTVDNYQSSYCSLGDVVTLSRTEKPHIHAALASANKEGALKHPDYFWPVWNHFSRKNMIAGMVFKMICPDGYVSLGGAVIGYSKPINMFGNDDQVDPDPSKYCCVKKDYVVEAEARWLWTDEGHRYSQNHIEFYAIERGYGKDASMGLVAGTFLPVFKDDPKPKGYLLKDDGDKVRNVWSLPANMTKPLIVFETNLLTKIWDPKGSSNAWKVSIWRPTSKSGYYPLGDIAEQSYSKPMVSLLVKATDPLGDALRPPMSYQRVWSDKGSGAKLNVQIWRAICPPNYVALGQVATDSPSKTPALGSLYCVKDAYTLLGQESDWTWHWSTRGTGADTTAYIYQANPTNSKAQTVRGFGVGHSYGINTRLPYYLNKDFIFYISEKPIIKVNIHAVRYNLGNEKRMSAPTSVTQFDIDNWSNIEQTSSGSRKVTVTEQTSFTFDASIMFGIETEVKAGIPFIASQKTTVKSEITTTFGYGSVKSTAVEMYVTPSVKIPPRSKITVIVKGTEYKADIPYTAQIKKTYYDGTEGFGEITGIYKGVSIHNLAVSYGKIEKLY